MCDNDIKNWQISDKMFQKSEFYHPNLVLILVYVETTLEKLLLLPKEEQFYILSKTRNLKINRCSGKVFNSEFLEYTISYNFRNVSEKYKLFFIDLPGIYNPNKNAIIINSEYKILINYIRTYCVNLGKIKMKSPNGEKIKIEY